MNTAVFSPCRKYRYFLWREWGRGSNIVMFIGLNPSTADETRNDPTVRRCIRYAMAWGADALCMTNIFAYRATLPKDMRAQADPIGPENDVFLKTWAKKCSIIVAAWGTDGAYLGRGNAVRKLIPKLHYLRLTKEGHPAHPLYLPKDLLPVPW